MNDKVPCSSTKPIQECTTSLQPPFELNLQLHGQVSNPYTFSINRDANSYVSLFTIPNTPDRVYLMMFISSEQHPQ